MDYVDSDYDSDLENLCIEVTEYSGHYFEAGRYFFFPETNEMMQLRDNEFKTLRRCTDKNLDKKFFNLKDITNKWVHVYVDKLH